jgi:hypothetical protein
VGIDHDADRYDMLLDLAPTANLAAELRRLASRGVTRVRAIPGTPLALALREADLVDLEGEPDPEME